MDVAWYGCDFPSGLIVAELPGLTAQGALSRRLGTFSSVSLSADLSAQTPEWIAATQPGRALLVACIDDVPVWGGIVLPRTRGSAATASPTATTGEGYLDRRYTRSLNLSGDLSSDIAAGLLAAVVATTPCFQVEAAASGATGSRAYADSADATVLSALTDLMNTGALEFTVDVRWRDDRRGFVLVARVAPRIGSLSPLPVATFDYPGPVVVYEQAESYEADKGATDILATGAGDGTSRVTSSHHVSALVAAGWPIYEYRFAPDQDAVLSSTLDAYAGPALALMESGASAWTLTANTAAAPALGADWSLGDQVRLLVQPGTSPGHPEGVDVTARAWGWDLDPVAGTVSPILVEDA